MDTLHFSVNTAQMEKCVDVAKKISVYISKEYFPKLLYMFCLLLFAPVPLSFTA